MFHSPVVSSSGRERGAELIEIALVLPLFVFLTFAVVDCARVALAYSTVRTAVQVSTRRGIAVDRPEWNVFAALPGPSSTSSLDDRAEFRSPDGERGWYTGQAARNHIPPVLYPVELRSLAYAYRIMNLSVGSIRYPCTGPDCVTCFTLRGRPEYREVVSPVAGSSATEVLGLECSYSVRILTSGFLWGWLPPVFDARARSFTNVESLTSGQYVREP